MQGIKRVLIGMVAAGAFGLAAPTANGATGTVSNGVPFTDVPGRDVYCTIAAVGTDAAGNKVAISAAHCVSHLQPGDTLYRWLPAGGQGEAIGTIASQGWRGPSSAQDNERDWLVIRLNDDAVLSSDGPRARLTSIATTDPVTRRDVVCKDGQTTGVTCGLVLSQTPNAIFNAALVGSGDSGGAAFVRDTQWVGVTFGYELDFDDSGARYLKASKVLADIEAGRSPVGKGFRITSTP